MVNFVDISARKSYRMNERPNYRAPGKGALNTFGELQQARYASNAPLIRNARFRQSEYFDPNYKLKIDFNNKLSKKQFIAGRDGDVESIRKIFGDAKYPIFTRTGGALSTVAGVVGRDKEETKEKEGGGETKEEEEEEVVDDDGVTAESSSPSPSPRPPVVPLEGVRDSAQAIAVVDEDEEESKAEEREVSASPGAVPGTSTDTAASVAATRDRILFGRGRGGGRGGGRGRSGSGLLGRGGSTSEDSFRHSSPYSTPRRPNISQSSKSRERSGSLRPRTLVGDGE